MASMVKFGKEYLTNKWPRENNWWHLMNPMKTLVN
jgi:hypothetical protein